MFNGSCCPVLGKWRWRDETRVDDDTVELRLEVDKFKIKLCLKVDKFKIKLLLEEDNFKVKLRLDLKFSLM